MRRTLILLLLLASLAYVVVYMAREHPEQLPDWYPGAAPASAVSYDLAMDFSQTSPCPSEAVLKQRFQTLPLECANQKSRLGDRVCWSDLKTFNGIEAKEIAFFFVDGKYSKLRVAFPVPAHGQLLAYLNDRQGIPPEAARGATGDNDRIASWLTPSGVLTTYVEEPTGYDETMLLWSSHMSIARSRSQTGSPSAAVDVLDSLMQHTFAEGKYCDGI